MNHLNFHRRATDNIFSSDNFEGYINSIRKCKASIAYSAEQQLLRLRNAKLELERQLNLLLNTKSNSLFGMAKRYFRIKELKYQIELMFEMMVSWMRATSRHFVK